MKQRALGNGLGPPWSWPVECGLERLESLVKGLVSNLSAIFFSSVSVELQETGHGS